MLARHVHPACPSEEIVFAFHLQPFNLQLGCFQIQLRAQTIDGGFKERERSAFEHEMSAKFAIAGVHGSLDGNFPRKIVGTCTKQNGEIAKLID